MSDQRINVTKTFLPPFNEYEQYLREIWTNGQLTNQGPLLQRFEKEVTSFLGVDNLHFVTNGTVALQLALRALDITEGEIITTPFSYVATTSAILWEHCEPVYVDIDPETLCIDANKIEAAITDRTKAILGVHVFGNPCDVEAIDSIAKRHNLKVIYDGAHAFGVQYKGRSLLSYGDVSTCSFHATKLFHTIEGGCLIAKDKNVSNKIELLKRFGHNGDDHITLGINAKASEFQAAMGLCNLKYIDKIIGDRKIIAEQYDSLLGQDFHQPAKNEQSEHNYSYYPVIIEFEEKLQDILADSSDRNIFPRRYFYPSLNTLQYVKNVWPCPISEDISRRIICLPIYPGLSEESVRQVCEALKR